MADSTLYDCYFHQGVEKPFSEVIWATVGDCQALGQTPITFVRQAVALASLPELLEDPKYPCDVKERVKRILNSCRGRSIGKRFQYNLYLQVIFRVLFRVLRNSTWFSLLFTYVVVLYWCLSRLPLFPVPPISFNQRIQFVIQVSYPSIQILLV